jgi:hypothetical protein
MFQSRMFEWFYDYPNFVVGPLIGIFFVGVTWLGILIFRSVIRNWIHGDQSVNDMIGFTFSGFSVLYGLLLGLLAVDAYQAFSVGATVVSREASALTSLYLGTQGYPEPIRETLQAELREYTRAVIEREWPEQRKGVVPTGGIGSQRAIAFSNELAAFEPKNKKEEIIHTETLRRFSNFLEMRRQRISDIRTRIPSVLWWVVWVGAMLNIALICMLDMKTHVHLILGGMLSLFLGLVIFLVAVLDNPFRGAVSVGADDFQLVYDILMKPRADHQ